MGKENIEDNSDISSLEDLDAKGLISEIKKLRKENASRRTKNKELEETNVSLNEIITSNSEKFGELQAAFDSLDREHGLTKKKLESSSFVSLDTVNLLKREHEKAISDLSSEGSTLKTELSKEKNLRTAYNALNNKGYKFRNSQERLGFETSILSSKEDGDFKNVDEILVDVNSFLNDNFEPVSLPSSGPLPNKSRITPAVEIANIIAKGNLTQEDMNRMMELEKEIETT